MKKTLKTLSAIFVAGVLIYETVKGIQTGVIDWGMFKSAIVYFFFLLLVGLGVALYKKKN